MLNLSRNNISTIEGLRELTRLRVLDLSYNRIFKIGHGMLVSGLHFISSRILSFIFIPVNYSSVI